MQFDTKRHKGRGHYYDKYFGLMKELGIKREMREAAVISICVL
jgi:hypothetical protein